MYLRRSRRDSPPQAMRSFSEIFLIVVLLNLSYRKKKFRTSSAIRSSEAATPKNFADFTEIHPSAGITLSNLFHVFFDSYSANTKNINVTNLKINVII